MNKGNIDRICAALRAAGVRAGPVRAARTALAHACPAVVTGGTRKLLVRLAALPSEGSPGTLVAAHVDSSGNEELIANEVGPFARPDLGDVMRARSVRMPDALWAKLGERGETGAVIREACEQYLARGGA